MKNEIFNRKIAVRHFLTIKKKLKSIRTSELCDVHHFLEIVQPHFDKIKSLGHHCVIKKQNHLWILILKNSTDHVICKTTLFSDPQFTTLDRFIKLLPSMFTVNIRRAFDATTYYTGLVHNIPEEIVKSKAQVLAIYGYNTSGDTVWMTKEKPVTSLDIAISDDYQ